ncbi:thiamine phosphate synthase [Kordiimonas sp. SCSIO 12610]|uniref:thiamine phosphate synthase n=1 Tax=Kordiimonas sp. SCSIO 12610 TaxID=2829597 RepID=UPI00210C5679|nr:thiamine phosphate synthase [Kordiimonas sp. SCSIO 12610]UTW54982.1 thiamine phosphate synthase [Kordiimonas sp. SCSIO 12610]
MAPTKEPCMLYLITPEVIEDVDQYIIDLENIFKSVEIACLQLRLKNIDDEQVLFVGAKIRDVCHAHDVAFIVNDRADLAEALDADAVHIGQGDGSIDEARDIIGFDRDIGVTCHDSMDLAFQAGEAGANYVAFGAYYPSETKATEHQADTELLRVWSAITELPCVAIGGITAENCGELVKAGADFIAVSGAVWNYPGGAVEGAKKLLSAIRAAEST